MLSWIKAKLWEVLSLIALVLSILTGIYFLGKKGRGLLPGSGELDKSLAEADAARQRQIALEAQLAKQKSDAQLEKDRANAEEHERKERERLETDQKAMRDRYLAEHNKLKS